MEKQSEKAFDVVRAEVGALLDKYFEKNEVPFAWEAKILMDIASDAVYDQFSAHETDIIRLMENVEDMKDEMEDMRAREAKRAMDVQDEYDEDDYEDDE